MADRRFAKVLPDLLHLEELLIDFTIHFHLVIIVLRQCTIDLAKAEVRMLAADFVGLPVVCKAI
jgi:hypothetical protein